MVAAAFYWTLVMAVPWVLFATFLTDLIGVAEKPGTGLWIVAFGPPLLVLGANCARLARPVALASDGKEYFLVRNPFSTLRVPTDSIEGVESLNVLEPRGVVVGLRLRSGATVRIRGLRYSPENRAHVEQLLTR